MKTENVDQECNIRVQGNPDETDLPVYQVVWSDENTAKVIPTSETVQTSNIHSKGCSSREIENSLAKSSREKSIDVVTATQNNLYQLKPIEHEDTEQILPCVKYSNAKFAIKHENSEENILKMKSDCQRKRFLNHWYNLPEFSNWLQESPIPGFAFCRVCRKDLQPGKSELLKHAATAKHERKMAALGHGNPAKALRQHVIDLRSDTVTQPSGMMKEVMINTEIKDIAYDIDPSVNEIEVKSSILLGKGASLFVPSGTLANLIALRTHCWMLNATVVLGDKCTMNSGPMGILDVLGISCKTVKTLDDGTLDIEELAIVFETCSANGPSTILLCIENTHERTGGQPISHRWMKKVNSICSQYGVLIHIDGTRLINASVALGEPLGKICEYSTTVMFEFDRGIGAPGGCVLSGPPDFINRAKIIHKAYGGLMRNAGILAAACLVGLTTNVKRIANDHNNAIGLAKGICSVNSSAVTVDVKSTVTNIVLLKCDNSRITPARLCERLMNVTCEEALEFNESIFIKAEQFPPDTVKLVLHGDITAEDAKSAVRKFHLIIREIENSVVEYISEVFEL